MKEVEKWFTEDLHKAKAVIIVLLIVIIGGYFHYSKVVTQDNIAMQQELTASSGSNVNQSEDFQALLNLYQSEGGKSINCSGLKSTVDVDNCQVTDSAIEQGN